MTESVAGFHIEGLRGLSRNATEFLRDHPEEARSVVAAALEAAAAQYGVDHEAIGIPEHLKPFVVTRSRDSERLDIIETAARLGVPRTTVYDWTDRGILLGWKSTGHGLTIPAEQILGPGRVVPGIKQLLDIIDDPELAWTFLSEEWPFENEVMRPIDKLKASELEDVMNAAPGYGTAFT